MRCTNAVAQPNCWRPWSWPKAQGAFGAAYLGALVSAPVAENPTPEATWLMLTDVPSQIEIDRDLSAYEAYVWALDVQHDHENELVLNGEVR
jgi:hypothetical protein